MRYRYVYVPEIDSARRHALNKIKKEIERTTSVEDIRDALEHYVFCELHDVIFPVLRKEIRKEGECSGEERTCGSAKTRWYSTR